MTPESIVLTQPRHRRRPHTRAPPSTTRTPHPAHPRQRNNSPPRSRPDPAAAEPRPAPHGAAPRPTERPRGGRARDTPLHLHALHQRPNHTRRSASAAQNTGHRRRAQAPRPAPLPAPRPPATRAQGRRARAPGGKTCTGAAPTEPGPATCDAKNPFLSGSRNRPPVVAQHGHGQAGVTAALSATDKEHRLSQSNSSGVRGDSPSQASYR